MASRTTQEPRGNLPSGLTPLSLFLVLLLLWTITQVQLVLVLGLLALVLGTILEQPVRFFQERRFPRPAAILMVYVIIIGALALLVVAIVPGIADQASTFSEDVPGQLRSLQEDWSTSGNPLLSGPGDQLLQRAIDTVEGDNEVSPDTAVDRAIPVVTSITGTVVSTLTLLVMTFYYLLEKRLIRRLILEALPLGIRPRVDRLWSEVENKVGGWMRGQLLLCLVIGLIATIAYGIIQLRFWPLLGIWAGITEIIPIIGPWIGGVPAVLIALTMSWQLALVTALIIVAMQTLENWVLVPRVMKGAVGLTPLTVFVAILAGTQLIGVVGAVLAIPVAATIQVILTDFIERRRSRDERTSARSGWRWMLSRSGIRDTGSDEDDDVDRDRPVTAAMDDEPYVAQQESESFAMQPVHEDDEDPGDVEHAAGTGTDEPEPETSRADAASTTGTPGSEPAPAPDDADEAAEEAPPAFAAWPRPEDRERKKPSSATWPPLEEGRPRRNRGKRDNGER